MAAMDSGPTSGLNWEGLSPNPMKPMFKIDQDKTKEIHFETDSDTGEVICVFNFVLADEQWKKIVATCHLPEDARPEVEFAICKYRMMLREEVSKPKAKSAKRKYDEIARLASKLYGILEEAKSAGPGDFFSAALAQADGTQTIERLQGNLDFLAKAVRTANQELETRIPGRQPEANYALVHDLNDVFEKFTRRPLNRSKNRSTKARPSGSQFVEMIFRYAAKGSGAGALRSFVAVKSASVRGELGELNTLDLTSFRQWRLNRDWSK